MSMLVNKLSAGKKLFRNYFWIISIFSVFTLTGAAVAAATITVTPSTGLANGQTVSVSGMGLAHNSTGAIVECNSDPSQPTIDVAGNPVPVSCTNPLSALTTTSTTGTLATTSFIVHSGTVGPPAIGKDSSGASASADAAKYPCPPTAAQIAAGDSCTISFGDANNDDAVQNIVFASQSKPTPTPTKPTATTPAATTPQNTTPAASSLVNTGPGNTIGLLVASAIIGGAARYIYLVRRKQHNQ